MLVKVSQVAGSQQPLEEVEVRQERREHTVRAVGREEGVPQLPHHLLEPAYLEVRALYTERAVYCTVLTAGEC